MVVVVLSFLVVLLFLVVLVCVGLCCYGGCVLVLGWCCCAVVVGVVGVGVVGVVVVVVGGGVGAPHASSHLGTIASDTPPGCHGVRRHAGGAATDRIMAMLARTVLLSVAVTHAPLGTLGVLADFECAWRPELRAQHPAGHGAWPTQLRSRRASIDKSFNRVGPTSGCFAGRPKGGLGRTAADGEMG